MIESRPAYKTIDDIAKNIPLVKKLNDKLGLNYEPDR